MSPIKKILKYFFHHSFSGEMVDRVHQRLAEPGDEREKEEVLREIWNEIGFPEADKRSEMAFARLENTLDVRPRPCLRIPAWVRIAAIWLIPLLSLGVSYYLYRDARDVKKLAFMEQFVPSGKRERITLPDGSEVWLNSGTLLLYPSDFIGDKREIYLVGEGYFKVRKRPEQPFIVRTKAMRVQVLGTEFNLSAYSGSDYSAWKEGGLLFNNDSFEDILKTLERVYNVKVHLRTSAYHSNRLTIHFNKNESLVNIMMLLKEIVPGLEYQIKEDGVYID